MIKVSELKGYASLRAFNAFHALMLGLKMLPSYMSETYDEFFARIEKMSRADQEKMIREAAKFVELEKEEVSALVSFASDANGVPYDDTNLQSLSPWQLVDIIVAVCMELSKIKIDLVTETEKKN